VPDAAGAARSSRCSRGRGKAAGPREAGRRAEAGTGPGVGQDRRLLLADPPDGHTGRLPPDGGLRRLAPPDARGWRLLNLAARGRPGGGMVAECHGDG